MSAGDGESAKYWMTVLTDIRTVAARGVFFVVCDGPVGPARRGLRFPRNSRHPLFASALGARWKVVEYVESKEVHDRVQGRGRASGDRFGSVDRGGRPGAERGRAVWVRD